jgi:hypothetical protein
VIFTNGNVVFNFFSLLQLNEGKPVLFILEDHPQPVLFIYFQFSGLKSLAIFLKKVAFFWLNLHLKNENYQFFTNFVVAKWQKFTQKKKTTAQDLYMSIIISIENLSIVTISVNLNRK